MKILVEFIFFRSHNYFGDLTLNFFNIRRMPQFTILVMPITTYGKTLCVKVANLLYGEDYKALERMDRRLHSSIKVTFD